MKRIHGISGFEPSGVQPLSSVRMLKAAWSVRGDVISDPTKENMFPTLSQVVPHYRANVFGHLYLLTCPLLIYIINSHQTAAIISFFFFQF